MSNAIDRLRKDLSRSSQDSLQRNSPPDLHELDGHIARLKKRVSASDHASPPRKHLEDAIRRFKMEGHLASFREAYLVSHGTLIALDRQPPIIEDTDRLPVLLKGVDQYQTQQRCFRRCYQGLLLGYFAYDPDDAQRPPSGRQNWLHLRRYLNDRSRKVLGDRHNPRWAIVLQEHLNLFSHDPCGRYGEDLLTGRRDAVDELRNEIRIADRSWFMRKLYLAQVRAILEKSDFAYLEHLPRLTEILTENTQITNEGLALTLDRHAAMEAPPNSAPLRELAVQRWGSPWLPSNSVNWARVKEPTQRMIANWLKLQFIRDFFTLLVEDRQGDTDRLIFWQRYASAMDEIHFALGTNARSNRSPDYAAMRRRIEGLALPLQDGSGNAFIMRMGPLVMVEFSSHSNACYGYKRAKKLPFTRDGAPLNTKVDAKNSLKNSRRALWLTHTDGNTTWQERFEVELASHGIYPTRDPEPTLQPGPSKINQAPPHNSGHTKIQPQPTPRTLDMHQLHQFADTEGLVINDLTEQGGLLWVRTDDSKFDISLQLKRWGFTYKNAINGWWIKRQ